MTDDRLRSDGLGRRPLAEQAQTLTLAAGGQGDVDALLRCARDAIGQAGGRLAGERVLGPLAVAAVFHAAPEASGRLIESLRRDPPATDWSIRDADAAPDGFLGRLLVCDMDSTIIACECIDEIAATLGIGEEIAAVTERAMRGELDFEAALEARVARLAGATEADLERVWAERVRLNPGATTLVATMKAKGARTVLVSGGFTWFTSRVARLAGFDDHRGNLLEIESGRLTGRVSKPILGRAAKRETLAAEAKALGAAEASAVAIGDGANDLDMMAAAGLGIAYRAKPAVEAQATARIASGDLRSALSFQGIATRDFVERG